ncbi:MAG: methylenetetrahydrofolate reductase [Thaumarchaeota archaeon]|nr:methylenetetrahydrofolate reductase [Nitrososphaerota archaeon]
MAFLRIVEVFPPMFPSSESAPLGLKEGINGFVEGVRGIRDLADVILVANVKKADFLKISTIEAAAMLQEQLRIDAAPVIVVRDQNRPQFLSSVLTAVALGLKSVMVAWGDAYPPSAKASNVRDFPSLAEAVRQASSMARRAGAQTRFFAPVDIGRLAKPGGVDLARGRIKAGAKCLLAQPPTTDAGETFDDHAAIIEKARLKARVLLNVFPFKGEEDVKKCEKYFGWKLPKSLHTAAAKGESSLLQMERRVVERLREEGFPGVYVTTRGTPSVAQKLLA